MDNKYQRIDSLLVRNGRIHRRVLEGRIRGLGIHPSQHMVLMHLRQNGRTLSQVQIAETLDVSAASVTRTIKHLEDGGYLERRGCAQDSRCNEISITQKGSRVVMQSREILDEMDGRIYAGFTGEELDTFYALLRRMWENLTRLEQNETENNQSGDDRT